MPQTALRIDGRNAVFMTLPDEKFVFIELYAADENFKPYGEPERTIEDKKTEEEIHRQLRIESSLKGHYVKEYSTDPQWNADYKPEQDEDTLTTKSKQNE